ncbi:MAG: hypothetical protein A2Y10_14130 [Planctomycetes bacterium GWF2_41_51]|nr:MAG: hypothetical protein A2Y10_14130 [Planctomycetes bacterium GWF2_41_51]
MNRKIIINFAVLAVLVIQGICNAEARYSRQVNLIIPAAHAGSFDAKIHNGEINITGSQTTDCNIAAEINIKAENEEKAKEFAEKVKFELVTEGDAIKVKIDRSDIPKSVQMTINMDVILPAEINLSLKTHNGKINAANIGKISALTHNGNITVQGASGGADLITHNGKINIDNIAGKIKAITHNGEIKINGSQDKANLLTHNGKIKYTGALADLKFESHNGNIDITCTGQSSAICNIWAQTHNSSISFAAPENFSAVIEASTHSGSINTDLPVTIIEKSKNKLKGTIGDGRNNLSFKTHSGSIKIK